MCFGTTAAAAAATDAAATVPKHIELDQYYHLLLMNRLGSKV